MQSEFIKARGDVVVTVVDRDGIVVARREQRNLIVNVGKTVLAHLLGGDASYATDSIAKVAFGSGSTAPAVTDTQLAAEIISKAVTVSYPAYNAVMYTATLLDNEGNGTTIRELGLVTGNASPKLFSRLLVADIAKTSAYQVTVEWMISFP